MKRISEWTERRVLDTIARAAAAGHDVNDLATNRAGTRALCSCGWESTPRARKAIAALAGLWHATEVCQVLDERRVLDGVEWSVAPSGDVLHRQSAHRAYLAGEAPPRRR